MPKRKKVKGFADVVKYPNGSLYLRCYPDGSKKQVERSLGLVFGCTKKSIKEARELALEKLDRVGSSASGKKNSQLFKLYIESRRAELHNQKKSGNKIREGTFTECKYIIESHLDPYFGGLTPEQIDESLWLSYCESKDLDLNNHRKVMNGFLKWCRLKKLIKFRPELDVPHWERRKRYILTPEEIRSLVQNADGKIFIFVSLCLFHWMRPGECTTIRKSNIDLENLVIKIDESTVKTKKTRHVPILPLIVPALKIQMQSDGEFLFPRRDRSELPAIKAWYMKSWKTLLQRSGLGDQDITPHDLRATGEKYGAKMTGFTGVPREKMGGASEEIQNRTYITRMDADELRGLESALINDKIGVKGLKKLLEKKFSPITRGKQGEAFSSQNKPHFSEVKTA